MATADQETGVVERIRNAILSGACVPGQRLVEAELVEAHGASRSVVRAALIELEHQGLVERIAHRGARVRVVSLEEAVEITELRRMLEGFCAARAAEKITDQQAAELRQVAEDMTAAVAAGDVLRYSGLNSALHERVIELAAQPVAAELLANLRARNVRHQFRLALRPGRPQQSLPQHLEIIDAVCSREPERAQRAVQAHLSSVIEALQQPEAASRIA